MGEQRTTCLEIDLNESVPAADDRTHDVLLPARKLWVLLDGLPVGGGEFGEICVAIEFFLDDGPPSVGRRGADGEPSKPKLERVKLNVEPGVK